jgi:hypothetical protein
MFRANTERAGQQLTRRVPPGQVPMAKPRTAQPLPRRLNRNACRRRLPALVTSPTGLDLFATSR